MLRGIAPVLNPDLLAILCRMGHGDEIVLADAHFPAESLNARVLRADGIAIPALLRGILPLIHLDQYDPAHLIMMAAVPGDQLDPQVETDYLAAISPHAPDHHPITRIDRFAFYERSKQAFAVVMSGETAKYGNILLKKGVTVD